LQLARRETAECRNRGRATWVLVRHFQRCGWQQWRGQEERWSGSSIELSEAMIEAAHHHCRAERDRIVAAL